MSEIAILLLSFLSATSLYLAMRLSQEKAKVTRYRLLEYLADRPTGASIVEIELALEMPGSVHPLLDELVREGQIISWHEPGGAKREFRDRRMVSLARYAQSADMERAIRTRMPGSTIHGINGAGRAWHAPVGTDGKVGERVYDDGSAAAQEGGDV